MAGVYIVLSVSLLENITWHQIRQTWWPVRLCWLFCCYVSNPELGQILIEVALDEVVLMWWGLIVLGNEVIIVIDNLWHSPFLQCTKMGYGSDC